MESGQDRNEKQAETRGAQQLQEEKDTKECGICTAFRPHRAAAAETLKVMRTCSGRGQPAELTQPLKSEGLDSREGAAKGSLRLHVHGLHSPERPTCRTARPQLRPLPDRVCRLPQPLQHHYLSKKNNTLKRNITESRISAM